MTIRRNVYKVERIVPVRFGRCTAVEADVYNPDPDDRGFLTVFGPLFGVGRNDKAKIRVFRQLLAPKAALYVSTGNAAGLEILDPPAGTKLPDGEHADVKVKAKAVDGEFALRVHAQAANGPIVGECKVKVSELITVKCAAHLAAIYALPGARAAGNTTNRTRPDVERVMDEVNRQWRPAAIRFNVDTWKNNTNMTNQVPRNGVNPTDGILLCPIYGTAETNENFDRLMNTNKVADRLNIYFVSGIQAAHTGPGAAPNYIGFGSSFHNGLVIADGIGDDETTAHTISHELGHIMTLAKMGHGGADAYASHSDDDPKFDMSVPKRRHDLWSRRRLMYYMVGLNTADRHPAPGRYSSGGDDVGYGAGRSGHMISLKHLAEDVTDDEYTDARTKAKTL